MPVSVIQYLNVYHVAGFETWSAHYICNIYETVSVINALSFDLTVTYLGGLFKQFWRYVDNVETALEFWMSHTLLYFAYTYFPSWWIWFEHRPFYHCGKNTFIWLTHHLNVHWKHRKRPLSINIFWWVFDVP